jgi:hypothetical protein
MRRWIGRSVCGMVLAAGVAAAQTTVIVTPTPSPTTAGAFDQLSPGNQKIAQALFEAHLASRPPGVPPALTPNDLAAMKQSGQGWGGIFKQLQAQGLVQEKNLGQVVRTYSPHQRTPAPSGEVVITTGSGRTEVGGHGQIDGVSLRRERHQTRPWPGEPRRGLDGRQEPPRRRPWWRGRRSRHGEIQPRGGPRQVRAVEVRGSFSGRGFKPVSWARDR